MVHRIGIIVITILILLTVCYIFFNSLQTGVDSVERSKGISDTVQSVIDPDNTIEPTDFHRSVRKMAHFMEFFGLGAVLYLLTVIVSRKLVGVFTFCPLFLALAIAVTDEYIQSFTERTSSAKDILIDFGGALCGMTLILIGAVIYKKIEEKSRGKA